MLLSKCVVCDSKKFTLIKEQEASGLLSSSGITTSPFSKSSFVLIVISKLIQGIK